MEPKGRSLVARLLAAWPWFVLRASKLIGYDRWIIRQYHRIYRHRIGLLRGPPADQRGEAHAAAGECRLLGLESHRAAGAEPADAQRGANRDDRSPHGMPVQRWHSATGAGRCLSM